MHRPWINRVIFTMFVLGVAIPSSRARGAEPAQTKPPHQNDDLKPRLEKLLANTKTLTWFQKVWQTNGRKEEFTTADCFWAAPDKIRMNVKEGRGAGATALYQNGKVVGFKPGVFSFVKLTYDVRDPEVIGVRGQDIRETGFLDDFAAILKGWDTVRVKPAGADQAMLEYSNRNGLPSVMWLDLRDLKPIKVEVTEQGKLVERYEYASVQYGAELAKDVFNP